MKLIVNDGELSLPEDFTFEIDLTNPFFSDEGSSSIPFTIPATVENLTLLGHPERPTRYTVYERHHAATLQVGLLQIVGTLIVDSVGEDGISATLAMRESVIYSSMKNKKLKDIFVQSQTATGTLLMNGPLIVDGQTYGWMTALMSNDSDGAMDDDAYDPGLTAFPVKASLDGVDFMINDCESSEDGCILNCDARTIPGNSGNTLDVEKYFGAVLFIRLWRLVDLLFQYEGFVVADNDLKEPPFCSLTVLNSCADMICATGGLHANYADMVPDMTVGEFVSWLRKKLGAVVIFDGINVSVKLLCNMLKSDYDADLTGKTRDGAELSYPARSRVVLKVAASIDGAAPPEENLLDFVKNYPEFDVHINPNILVPGRYFIECLGRYGYRESTGMRHIGSKTFTYDRRNTDECETFDCEDEYVPMVMYNGSLVPYVGEAVLQHSTVGSEAPERKQSMMICWDFYVSYHRFGTTQTTTYHGTIPAGAAKSFPLYPEGMYDTLWKAYNELLLNGAPTLSAQIDFSLADLLSLDISARKLINGQLYLMKSLSFRLGPHGLECGKTSLLCVPEYRDKVIDSVPAFAGKLEWEYVSTAEDVIKEFIKSYRYEIISYEAKPVDSVSWLKKEYSESSTAGYKALYAGQIILRRDRRLEMQFKYRLFDDSHFERDDTTRLRYEEYFIARKVD